MARPKKVRDAEDKRNAADYRCSVSRVAFLAGVDSSTVSNARATQAMPRNPDGTYSWPAVRAWAQEHGCLGYGRRAVASPAPSADNDAAKLSRFKALEAERAFNERMGLLISRSEAERDHLRIVLALRAALLALPEQLAPQLANLDAREAAAVLAERMQWICAQHQEGMVAIPAELERAVENLVEQHVVATTPEPAPGAAG